jgi:plastocyanin
MNQKSRRAIYGLSFAISATACVASIKGCSSGAAPAANEVLMQAIAFNPAEITIRAGESVTWTNQDIVQHTATSGNPGDADLGAIFRSASLGQGGTFTHTFNDVGEFVYFCEFHPTTMRGAKVIVNSAN